MSTSSVPQWVVNAAEWDMDPYVIVCRALKDAGVPFLVIGAFGINLHAIEMGKGVVTHDLDLLLPARSEPLAHAFRSLAQAGATFTWMGESLPIPNEWLLADLVRARACIKVTLGLGEIDLVLLAAGLDFDELWPRREARTLGTLSVDTIPLVDLLRSKAAANRSKDRFFLEIWREQLGEMLQADERRRARCAPDPPDAP
ncbi:MAG TPA: hypothetical protein VK824_10075 [Planctomycetota bacterium]|nr:hypothetical protein [Planctomycetota bacterium]